MSRPRHDDIEFGSPEGSMGETRFGRKVAQITSVINENVSISFKFLIPVSALIITSTWFISRGISKIERRLEDSWHVTDMERWSREVRKQNPTFQSPDVREIFEANPARTIQLAK